MTCSAHGLHERAAAAGTLRSSQRARHSQLRPAATSLVDESDASDAFLLSSNWRTSVATPGAVSKEPLAAPPAPPAALPRRARVREQPGLTWGVAGPMPASAAKETKK